jgi:hypothetical protein
LLRNSGSIGATPIGSPEKPLITLCCANGCGARALLAEKGDWLTILGEVG